MPTISASFARTIDAPSDMVYSILSDYRTGHPAILPPRYFSDFTIVEGGIGAGTVIRFQFKALGTIRTMRMRVEVPVPGRVMTETDLDNGARTTFSIVPREANRCSVTISTSYERSGMPVILERMLVPRLLRSIYSEQLRNLAGVAEGAR